MDHPLNDCWTFWCLHRQHNSKHIGADNYELFIKKVGSVSTVEDFWAYYCHTKKLNELSQLYDIHLFRDPIRPVWEDPRNLTGGKIALHLKKGFSGRLWEQLVLTMIGEKYEIIQEILGVIVSSRFNEDVISIWIANSEEHEILKEFIKKSLNLPPNTLFEYKAHNQSIKDTLNGANKQNTSQSKQPHSTADDK